MYKAEPLEKEVSLETGKRREIDLYPSFITGKVQISAVSENAHVEIIGDDGENFKSKGIFISDSIPAGYYTLSVSEKGADIGMDMVLVRGGSFRMGGKGDDEKPLHKVTLSRYYIGKTEVTQEQWNAVMDRNPSCFKGENLPVDNVSWFDAIEFCNRLSILDSKEPVYSINGHTNPDFWKVSSRSGSSVIMNSSANGYMLPTEAEWEYAARGGQRSTKSLFRGYKYNYSGSNSIDDVAWYTQNSEKSTRQAGSKQPNQLGIYDMSGNVWEWCWDWYGKYSRKPQNDPKGPASGRGRVLRGGAWDSVNSHCQVAKRYYFSPDTAFISFGFRVVRSL